MFVVLFESISISTESLLFPTAVQYKSEPVSSSVAKSLRLIIPKVSSSNMISGNAGEITGLLFVLNVTRFVSENIELKPAAVTLYFPIAE